MLKEIMDIVCNRTTNGNSEDRPPMKSSIEFRDNSSVSAQSAYLALHLFKLGMLSRSQDVPVYLCRVVIVLNWDDFLCNYYVLLVF